ncbi:unnamed protein product [Soboliphyme baturini]|uniref:Uncharacterized protein n=1 Tax=Soboliphyme baturini TaxID=241478 RepID=A0A183J8I0_9BILA|nr:unnamed protein product [Soboliphyme baturini]
MSRDGQEKTVFKAWSYLKNRFHRLGACQTTSEPVKKKTVGNRGVDPYGKQLPSDFTNKSTSLQQPSRTTLRRPRESETARSFTDHGKANDRHPDPKDLPVLFSDLPPSVTFVLTAHVSRESLVVGQWQTPNVIWTDLLK